MGVMRGLKGGTASGIAFLTLLAGAGAAGRPAGVQLAVGYASTAALEQALATTHSTLVRDLESLHVAQVRADDAAALRGRPGIRFVEDVSPRPAAAAPEPAVSLAASPEWQLRALHADTVPDAVLRAAGGLTIAVIDTGADLTAPDLAAKSPLVWNTRTGSTDVRDANGHGTFVASLAGGSVTNADGFAGNGGDAKLLIVKSGNDHGSFTDLDEAAGIVYAVDHGARIINLSVGGPSTSTTERKGIQYAIDHGALVVAAVGNEYGAGNPVEYPAALLQPVGSNGIGGAGLAVTASSTDGRRAVFANTGSWVSLAAPGDHVFGAVSATSSPSLYPRTTLPGAKTGLYGYGSGTSFAAPQVAGAAALVWAANPALTAQQVAQILKETASGNGRWTSDLGFGIVDVAAAVARAQAGGPLGVLISARRGTNGKVRLNWGGDAASFSLTMTTDGTSPQTLLTSTKSMSTTLALKTGHSYTFGVTGLDAAGAPISSSSVSIR